MLADMALIQANVTGNGQTALDPPDPYLYTGSHERLDFVASFLLLSYL